MATRRLPSSPLPPPHSLDETPLAPTLQRASSQDSGASATASSSAYSTSSTSSSSHLTRLGSTLSSLPSSSARSADPAYADRELQSAFLGMDRSMWSATANLANVITGSGIIGLPYATRQCGLLLALLLLLLLSACTLYSLQLLISSAHRLTRKRSVDVEDLLGHAFGPFGHSVGLFAVFALDLGVMVALLIVIGDTVPPVLSHYTQGTALWPLTGRTPTLLLVSVAFILPSSSLRSLSSLSLVSLISIASVVALTFVVVVRSLSAAGPAPHHRSSSQAQVEWVGPHPLRGFGSMAFVFVCHDVALQLYAGLRVKSMVAWGRVSRASVAIASVPVLVLSVVGYLSFLDTTASNVLNHYPVDDHAVNVARLLLATSMALTYPTNLMVCRRVATQLLAPTHHRKTLSPAYLHAALTAGLFGFSVCVALAVDDLGPLQSLVGSLCAVSLAFLIPAVGAIRLAQLTEHRPLLSWRNAGPWALTAFGACIVALSLITQLSDLFLPTSYFTLPEQLFVL